MRQLRILFSIISIVCFSHALTGQADIEKGSIYFSIDLYKKISSSKKSNVFYSPLSVTYAMSIPYLGSRNLTKKQMEGVMYYGPDQARNFHGYKTLIENLESANTEHTNVTLSNSMWVQKDFELASGFVQTYNRNFQEGLNQVDFLNKTNESRLKINDWVAAHTDNKIQDLMPPNSINVYTKFVVANGIYFSGTWKHAFDKSLTSANDFQIGEDEFITTNFMKKQKSIHKYYENEQVKVIELPYEGDKISMLLVLPQVKMGLKTIEDGLNYKMYKRWLKSLEKREVVLTLPKFRLSKAYRTKRYLRKLGLKEPFTDQANFSGITKQQVKLSDIVHKAFIEVNEKGTYATAASGVTGTLKGISEPIVHFHANHPFLYIIKDNTNDVILFMGRLRKPEYVDAPLSDYDKPPREVYDGIKQSNYDKFHVVQKGETLFRIAQRYQTSVFKIQKMNQLPNAKLKIGQQLLVIKGKLKRPMPSDSTLDTSQNLDIKPKSAIIHTVKKGETLYKIAQRYNVNVEVIKVLNQLDHHTIAIGQKLIIQKATGNNEKGVHIIHVPEDDDIIPCNCEKHVVQKGETLFRLARQYDTSITKIKSVNQLDSNRLAIGQRLVIERVK